MVGVLGVVSAVELCVRVTRERGLVRAVELCVRVEKGSSGSPQPAWVNVLMKLSESTLGASQAYFLVCPDSLDTHKCGRERVQGLLEIKDTHRPYEGPMLLGINLP
jgi:hypothetical protein